MTSRDVIFYEESMWNWNGQQPTQVLFDSDTADERHQPLQQQISAASIPENSSNEAPTTIEHSPIAAEAPNIAAELLLRHVRKRPAWMTDYEVTGIDQYEDPLIHFALFSDCDPTAFEETIKIAKDDG